MADIIVSALVKELSRRLISEVDIQGCNLGFGFQDDISTLREAYTSIQAVLQDAEEKRNLEMGVDLWLKRLRSASLMVENVLDDISTEALLQRLNKKRGIKHRVSAFFSSEHNQFMFRLKISRRVKALRRSLDALVANRFALNLIPSVTIDDNYVDLDVAHEMSSPYRVTSPIVDSSIIYGRDIEVGMITRTICNQEIGKYKNGEIWVYGLWGMGGVGKTTLARLVYNHERVKQHFDFRCWVYVSQLFDVKNIMYQIIGSEYLFKHKDVLQHDLQNKLRGKRFLVVLDDVWIEDDGRTKWDELSNRLSCGADGSIVVITTRSWATCRMMAKVPELQHKVGFLSIEESWLLFKRIAFAHRTQGDDMSELEPIGREMVEKCKGLPLAVVALGRLLWSKHSTSDWQRLKNDNIWELQENSVMLALKLSYDNLLPHLKRCFRYCCLFPKGYCMEKDVVIQLWVVNGFIPSTGENLYGLGEDIINCLVERSFFHVVKDQNYSNDRYEMHDLMHEMAQYVTRDDCLLIEPNKEVIFPNQALHLSSSCPDIQFSPLDLEKLKSLRSVFMFGVDYMFNINHVYLRVLYLCGSRLYKLPESIYNLIHLKYLNLSYSNIEVVSDSIIYLQNLEVLLLNFCYQLRKLPDCMGYMSRLRILETNSCHSLLNLPNEFKEMTKLPRITRFQVGKEKRKIGELGDANYFEGELEISGLENVEGLDEAQSAKLKNKTNLMELTLSWSNVYTRESKRKMFVNDENVLKGLEPNSSLKKLSIYFFMGDIIPSSWIVKLDNLVEIGFSGCKRCESIPPLGGLPNLKVIKLLGMYSLLGFNEKDTSKGTNIMFRCLKELNIFMCPNLISLPNNLSTLEVLKLEECGALTSLPVESLKDMKQLKISGCAHLRKYEDHEGWSEISHIPNIRIGSLSYITQDSAEIEE